MKTPARKRAGVCLKTEDPSSPSWPFIAHAMDQPTFSPRAFRISAHMAAFSSATSHPCAAHQPLPHLNDAHAPGSHNLLPQRTHHRVRGIFRSVLTLTCAGFVLMTAAMVLDPATLQARSTSAPTLQRQRSVNQEFVKSLGDLVGECEQVLAVRPANAQRGAEMILWRDDTLDPERINASELSLVRHNPLFGTITVYALASERLEARRVDSPSTGLVGVGGGLMSAVLTESDLAAPGFIERWRALPSVEARVLANGLADFHIEALEAVGHKRLSLLRLRLTFSDDWADGTHEASAVVQAGRRRAIAFAPQHSAYAP